MTGPSPLVSAVWLAAHVDDPDLLVADVRWYLAEPGRGRQAYADGHLPGAVFVDVDTDLTALDGPGRHPLPSPELFADRMASLGIDAGTRVVAYDDVGGWVASRLWWMLDALGNDRVAVLDGGIQAWVAAGGSLTTADLPTIPTSTHSDGRPLDVPATWPRVMDREAVRASLGSAVLLDARGGPRYRGETEPIDPVAGHIPTAINAPTDGNLAADGRFLPASTLRQRFVAVGASEDGSPEVITSCGSGISACHNALAMRVAGLPDPALYEGSYSDWSRAGLPVAVGPEPGPPPR